MKRIFIIVAAVMLCGFGYDHKQKIQRRKGVLIESKKGFEFVPLEQWQDYSPKANGDTLFQIKIS